MGTPIEAIRNFDSDEKERKNNIDIIIKKGSCKLLQGPKVPVMVISLVWDLIEPIMLISLRPGLLFQ